MKTTDHATDAGPALWGPYRVNGLLDLVPPQIRPLFKPGNVWRHYKGHEYVVVDLVRIEMSGLEEVAVAYRSLTDPSTTWVRPLREWCEKVAWTIGEGPRFAWVRSLP